MALERYFYRLDESPTYVKRTSDSYWGYVTLESLIIYEKIYHELCKMMPESNGYVWCELNCILLKLLSLTYMYPSSKKADFSELLISFQTR